MSQRPAAPVRRGGAGTSWLGERLTWTVSAGTRGRRWREIAVRDGAAVRSVLLESDADGRWNHVELATSHGLLTLHPEADRRSVHGNVVRPDGIEHVTRPWSPDHALVVVGSPAALAIVLGRLGGMAGAGEATEVPALLVQDDLAMRPTALRIRGLGGGTWAVTIDDGAPEQPVTLDEDGVVLLEDARSWALEVGAAT